MAHYRRASEYFFAAERFRFPKDDLALSAAIVTAHVEHRAVDDPMTHTREGIA